VSDVAWRLLVLAVAAGSIGWLLWHLRIVIVPVLVALLVCSVLTPPVVALERRGVRTLLATWLVFGAALLTIGALLVAVIPPTVDQFSDVRDALGDGIEDVEQWLVDGPLSLDREQVRSFTSDPIGRASEVIDLPSGAVTSGARSAGELLAGTLLAIILTFLLLKDGRRLQETVLARIPDRQQSLWRASGRRAWSSLSGFVRGAAVLGAVEGTVIGITMTVVGAPLALPVAALTFVGAFFPVVGALVTGAIAALVTLAGAGVAPAVVVLAVVIVVQQLDNDLLAPFIYGRSLDLHPTVVLLSLATGATLGGILGAFVAVPLTALLRAVGDEVWRHRTLLDRAPDP
jgi:predicted PurR-regulated permease PerM